MSTALRELSNWQRRAGGAAIGLLFCLILPWYRSSFPVPKQPIQHDNMNALEAFSWVEAAVLVIAASVLYLLYARSQRRGFHLPGGDGWAVTLAGGWTLFLLVWRLFDRPGVEQGSVGVQWGLFVTMLVAGGLLYVGQAMRAEGKAEPPNPAEDIEWSRPPAPERRRGRRAEDRRRAPVDSHALTQVLREDKPDWEGEPPEPPRRAARVEPKDPPDEGKLF